MASHLKGAYKYGQPKRQRTISITDTAWQYLKSYGGTDYLEQVARSRDVELVKLPATESEGQE